MSSTPRELALTHASIWWLHDAADYDGVEQAGLELVSDLFPELEEARCRDCAEAIRRCYIAYDASQACVREWRLADHPRELALLREAHRDAREAWRPGVAGMEEGYFAFFAHSMWLHTPGWRRPFQKLWRNPARLAGIWRYHRASFPRDKQHLVYGAVRCLFWAGLQGHDYKSRKAAEAWLEQYWTLLQGNGIRHLFF